MKFMVMTWAAVAMALGFSSASRADANPVYCGWVRSIKAAADGTAPSVTLFNESDNKNISFSFFNGDSVDYNLALTALISKLHACLEIDVAPLDGSAPSIESVTVSN